jgi:hypothetical protein
VVAGSVAWLALAAGSLSAVPGEPIEPAHPAKAHMGGCVSRKVACTFSTPDGNIRCRWTPTPSNVACKILSSHHAYRLFPTGRGRATHLGPLPRGKSLRRNHDLVFPGSLSCRSSGRSMRCNQDYGMGGFELSRERSRAF